ncbi:MAG: hypothetical protein HY204_01750 [Nitrospirae bacterium]|nr:hypothetical protein [Nitrospirota bacterium]
MPEAEEELRRQRDRLEALVKKRAAELEAVNKELEAFCHSVSHDLRAPLRSMDGFSRLLIEEYGNHLDDRGRDYLERVRAGALRMMKLIEDLLSLSRLGRSEMQRERLNLSALAEAAAAKLKESQPGRRVEFRIAPDLTVEGDRRLLRAVMEHLLGNAWKFTEKHPKAVIEFGATGREGQPIFFVRDDGAGFDMAYSHKLFGAFQRLHSPAEFPGNGIGLAVVQRIIHRHGGRVWAEGAVEKGAMFYFTIESSAML